MASYSQTKKIWSQWYQKAKYAEFTNQPDNIEMSKHLVDTYGPRMTDCSVFCELGVGSGRNIYYFHEKYPDWKYLGNDISPNIHNEIRSVYPDLLDWADIEINDTLCYLRNPDFETDITFTHGHLMHLPNEVIKEVCQLIAAKTQKYLLLNEAYINGRGLSLRKKLKYRKYRFDRDYENMFPGFILRKKHISDHPTKKAIRHGIYLFKKDNIVKGK